MKSEGLHPGVHPDPDALNAFVEGVLPEHARVECLAHLAECLQCREVVFLARKAEEIEEPAAVAQAPVSFWRRLLRPIPAMSMVAIALAVVSFGIIRMTQSPELQPTRIARTARVGTSPVVGTGPVAEAERQTPEPSKVSPQAPTPLGPKGREQPTAFPTPAAPPPAVVTGDAGGVAPLAEAAGVTGTITDPAGAAIASAQVELKNEDTGATFRSTSGASGSFSIAGMPAGRYDLGVTSPGFRKFVKSGVSLEAQQIARLDSTLQVGAATESVTVTAEAALLKTESGEISHQADLNSLNNLPFLTGTRGSAWILAGSNPTSR